MRSYPKPRRDTAGFEASADLAVEAPCRYFGLREAAELVGTFDHVIERRQLAGDAPASGPAILASASSRVSDAVLLAAEQIEINRGRKPGRLLCPQIGSAEEFGCGRRIVEQPRIDRNRTRRKRAQDMGVVPVLEQAAIEGPADVGGIAYRHPARRTEPELLASDPNCRRALVDRQDNISEGLTQIRRALVVRPLNRTTLLGSRIDLRERPEIFRQMQVAMEKQALLVRAKGFAVRGEPEQIGIIAVEAVAGLAADAQVVFGRPTQMDVFEALVIGQRLGLAGQPEIVFLPSIEPQSDRLLGSRIVTGCFLRMRRLKGENTSRRANQTDTDRDAACPAHRTFLPSCHPASDAAVGA